jgi:hypothetical protein
MRNAVKSAPEVLPAVTRVLLPEILHLLFLFVQQIMVVRKNPFQRNVHVFMDLQKHPPPEPKGTYPRVW